MPPAPPATRRLAADVAKPLPLSPEALNLLTPDTAPRAFFDALCAAGLSRDALRFLAAALPKPEAVWWAHGCARDVLPDPTPVEAKAFAAAAKWAAAPNETNRRAAQGQADAAGWGTAAGCLAGAAWLSGGSLSPPDLPVVAPRDDLTAQTVAGALLLLLAADPLKDAARVERFLTLGRAVAAGESRPG